MDLIKNIIFTAISVKDLGSHDSRTPLTHKQNKV